MSDTKRRSPEEAARWLTQNWGRVANTFDIERALLDLIAHTNPSACPDGADCPDAAFHTPPAPGKVEEAINDYGSATFLAGAWDEESAEKRYEEVKGDCDIALAALLAVIAADKAAEVKYRNAESHHFALMCQRDLAAMRERAEAAEVDLAGWVAWAKENRCIACGEIIYTDHPEDQDALDKLKLAHVEVCPKHPLAAMKAERDSLAATIDLLKGELKASDDGSGITNVVEQMQAQIDAEAKHSASLAAQLAEAKRVIEAAGRMRNQAQRSADRFTGMACEIFGQSNFTDRHDDEFRCKSHANKLQAMIDAFDVALKGSSK